MEKRERARVRNKKQQRRPILLVEKHENVTAAVKKMRNVTGHAPRRKWAAVKKKVNRNTYIPSIKRVTGKFLEVSRCSRAKQRQRNVQ